MYRMYLAKEIAHWVVRLVSPKVSLWVRYYSNSIELLYHNQVSQIESLLWHASSVVSSHRS